MLWAVFVQPLLRERRLGKRSAQADVTPQPLNSQPDREPKSHMRCRAAFATGPAIKRALRARSRGPQMQRTLPPAQTPPTARNPAQRVGEPPLQKEVTAELGNFTPYIIVPGSWSDDDIAFQANNVAAGLVQNNGHNCLGAEVGRGGRFVNGRVTRAAFC